MNHHKAMAQLIDEMAAVAYRDGWADAGPTIRMLYRARAARSLQAVLKWDYQLLGQWAPSDLNGLINEFERQPTVEWGDAGTEVV